MRTQTLRWAIIGSVFLLLAATFRYAYDRSALRVADRDHGSGQSQPLSPPKTPAAAPASQALDRSPEQMPKDAVDPELKSMFGADASGKLVLNESTRLNLEKLHALNTPEEFIDKLKRLSAVLPATAHAELLRLAASYVQYVDAVHATFPPEATVETVGQAEAELNGIHQLRIEHFGPEATEALYGAEMRMNRRLIELMALEADPSLSLAEKAHRAQMLMQSSQDERASPAK
jgi:lipase chaperone LimK